MLSVADVDLGRWSDDGELERKTPSHAGIDPAVVELLANIGQVHHSVQILTSEFLLLAGSDRSTFTLEQSAKRHIDANMSLQ